MTERKVNTIMRGSAGVSKRVRELTATPLPDGTLLLQFEGMNHKTTVHISRVADIEKIRWASVRAKNRAVEGEGAHHENDD